MRDSSDSSEGSLPPPEARLALTTARRVVVKIGTRVIAAGGSRLHQERLKDLLDQVVGLAEDRRELLLVSSGAVGLGAELLRFEQPPEDLADRQACAAVGQALLMQSYQELLAAHGLLCAQVLLTEDDFDDRKRYLNLRSTLSALLDRGVVPVINENDVVSVDELELVSRGRRPVFGDNDRLSALVATKLGAELLILVTDVEGLYDRDPRVSSDAHLVDRVDDAESLAASSIGGTSPWGRGGMASKVAAAEIAARSGCHAVIASGTKPGTLERVLAGEVEGTWFPARGGLDARRRWIAFAARARASLTLDEGAVMALRTGTRSLLAAGVRRIEGKFKRGDVIELFTEDGRKLGRGMAACDIAAARLGGAEQPPSRLSNQQPLIRRDRMVLEPWVRGPEAAATEDSNEQSERGATP